MNPLRKRLGEIVIRSGQPDALVAFYREVIGLEPFASFGSATFLKIDDDFEGHPLLNQRVRSHLRQGQGATLQ